MIYLIGGAPRTGKSILGQRVAAKLNSGWISTDLLLELLRTKQVQGIKTEWDARPEAISANAEWFFPCLERFVWGVSSMATHYLIEGVDFLPAQAAELSASYPCRAIFLGCSTMTLHRFEAFPGHSPGYAHLPEALRRRFACDIPLWSAFIQEECARFNLPYLDMTGDFVARLNQAAEALTVGDVLA